MKIAVCVCNVDLLDNNTKEYLCQYKKFLINRGHSVDYFLHQWSSDINAPTLNWFIVNEHISKKEKLIEKLSTFLPKKLLTKSITFYELMRAANLKINYEIENNISYDICIAICGKINYFDYNVMSRKLKNPKINTVYTFGCKESKIFPYFSINYKFFYSDTLTFNKIAEFFRFLPNTFEYLRSIPEDYNGMPLAYYIKALNVNNENTPSLNFGVSE